MYPSISVCKKWAFDYASLDFENEEYSHENVSTFIEWVNEYSVRMEDQFYFFTLPGVKNLTFPCTTTVGGMTLCVSDRLVRISQRQMLQGAFYESSFLVSLISLAIIREALK